MCLKLEALHKVNKKINELQDKLQIKMSSDDGFTFDFDIPKDDAVWIDSHELGENTLYKSIKLFNYDEEKVKLILFYGKQGSKVKKHNHSEPHLMVCVEGRVDITVDDEVFNIRKGQSLLVNTFQWHSIDFIEASKIIIIYI